MFNVKELAGYTIQAKDGEIGKCRDFLFDDRFWAIRYMVADTAGWLKGLKVLVSPIALDKPDWDTRIFPVKLTRQQVKDGPPLDEGAPVTAQYEKQWFDYYGWRYYWIDGNAPWGRGSRPSDLYTGQRQYLEEGQRQDRRLRSVNTVLGYHIQATDGEIGHMEDMILDEDTWVIRLLIVETGNWLTGRLVPLSPVCVKSIDEGDKKVHIELTTEAVKNAPEYDLTTPLRREFEIVLSDYYGWPRYWES